MRSPKLDSSVQAVVNNQNRISSSEKMEVLANWLRVNVDQCFTKWADITVALCEAEIHLGKIDYPPCIRCQAIALAAYLGIDIDE